MEHLDGTFKDLVEELKKGSHASPSKIKVFALKLMHSANRVRDEHTIRGKMEEHILEIIKSANQIVGDMTKSDPLSVILGRVDFPLLRKIETAIKAIAAELKYEYEEFVT